MLKAYSILDTKAQIYNPPFYQRNAGEASRSFSKIVNDKQSLINQFPEDYTLVQIGAFDDETGLLVGETHVIIGNGSQFIAKP